MPSLSSFCGVDSPGVPRSTTNALMPLLPAAVSVFAYTIMTSAPGAFVIHIFDPLSTYSSPSRTAVVRMLTTSEPAPASLIARAPRSPDPQCRSWLTQRLEWAPYDKPTDAEARLISSIAMTWAR